MVATLMLHEIIWKRETAINQIIQGLKMLNVLQMIQKAPQNFLNKFVQSSANLTGELMLEWLDIAEPGNNAEEEAKNMFKGYIMQGDNIVISCGHGNTYTNTSIYAGWVAIL